MRKKLDIALRPEKIHLTGNCIIIVDFHSGKYMIPYKGIILACLYICDTKSGICYEPEFAEIKSEMDGELVIYDTDNSCFRIQTELTGKKAGALLFEIAFHAPYILLGGQPWLDVKSQTGFSEAEQMVKLMRECLLQGTDEEKITAATSESDGEQSPETITEGGDEQGSEGSLEEGIAVTDADKKLICGKEEHEHSSALLIKKSLIMV